MPGEAPVWPAPVGPKWYNRDQEVSYFYNIELTEPNHNAGMEPPSPYGGVNTSPGGTKIPLSVNGKASNIQRPSECMVLIDAFGQNGWCIWPYDSAHGNTDQIWVALPPPADNILNRHMNNKTNALFADFHAEATSTPVKTFYANGSLQTFWSGM